jgi:hypothetical protein
LQTGDKKISNFKVKKKHQKKKKFWPFFHFLLQNTDEIIAKQKKIKKIKKPVLHQILDF